MMSYIGIHYIGTLRMKSHIFKFNVSKTMIESLGDAPIQSGFQFNSHHVIKEQVGVM